MATCDEPIAKETQRFGGKFVMTRDTHQRASDRVAEAMEKIEKETNEKIDIVVMIQGDEPLVFPQMIDEAVGPVVDQDGVKVTNLMAPLKTQEEQEDPNEIKVVTDKDHFALYFSRNPIPMVRDNTTTPFRYKQVCIIAFERDFLLHYTQMKETPLEIAESVDMLRIIEEGERVKMVLTDFETYSVDTEEDLKRVEAVMARDALFQEYSQRI